MRRDMLLLGTALSVLGLPVGVPAAAAAVTTVFVAGASGSTGRRVVRELRRKGLKVRAGVRDVEKARANGIALDEGVELVTADVTRPESLGPAIAGAQAVISAIGYNGGADAKGYEAIDNKGNVNLVDAAVAGKVGRFVLMSSLLTNGAAAGQAWNPGYVFLNLFGNVLTQKLIGVLLRQSENYLRRSSLDWTIVRPGGLKNEEVGSLVVGREDTLFGLPTNPGKDISRDTVAQVLVEAVLQPQASRKVVEVVESKSAPQLPVDQWFAKV